MNEIHIARCERGHTWGVYGRYVPGRGDFTFATEHGRTCPECDTNDFGVCRPDEYEFWFGDDSSGRDKLVTACVAAVLGVVGIDGIEELRKKYPS